MVWGEALALILAGVTTPIILGGYRWLRKLTAVVGQIADVTQQLGNVTAAQAELSRQIRATRRELHLHVRECACPTRLPRPRAGAGAGA